MKNWLEKSQGILNLKFLISLSERKLKSELFKKCKQLGLVEDVSGGEEFADFRTRVSELIKDVVFVVGSSHCFRQMFFTLTGEGSGDQPTPTWDSTEASLFVMQAVAKNILPLVPSSELVTL